MIKISKHFTLEEAIKSQIALRKGIENIPSNTELIKIKAVANGILEPCREHFGKPIKPSSWFRCKALNTAIGGSTTSQHCKGEAVDFEVSGVPNIELARWIHDNLEFDQLILEFYEDNVLNSGWVHCSLRKFNNRKQCLSTSNGYNYVALNFENIPENKVEEVEEKEVLQKKSIWCIMREWITNLFK